MDYSALAGSCWKLAPGSLTSGGNHLYSKRLASGGGHLCTDGSPATAATFAPVACRQRRPPQRVRRGPHPRPPMVVWTRPSKNVATTSMAYDVLYDPSSGIRAVWPAAQGTPRMRRICARRDRRPCDGRTAGGRQRWRRHQSHQSRKDGATAWLASHPKELGREGWCRGSARCPPS
jgi:hypothetical protein